MSSLYDTDKRPVVGARQPDTSMEAIPILPVQAKRLGGDVLSFVGAFERPIPGGEEGEIMDYLPVRGLIYAFDLLSRTPGGQLRSNELMTRIYHGSISQAPRQTATEALCTVQNSEDVDESYARINARTLSGAASLLFEMEQRGLPIPAGEDNEGENLRNALEASGLYNAKAGVNTQELVKLQQGLAHNK